MIAIILVLGRGVQFERDDPHGTKGDVLSSTPRGTAIVGVGETEFKRRSDRTIEDLILEASRSAIADAGLRPEEIDGFIPAVEHPNADALALALGATRKFTAKPGYVAGAATVGAVLTARLAIEAGLATNVLVYFGMKGSNEGGPYSFHAEDVAKAGFEMPFGWYGQPVYFAAWAQRYCYDFGVDPNDFASVAVAAREWARISPGAQKTTPLDNAGYLASPMISTPLRAADCCLISDGGAAYVVTSLERARGLRHRPAVVAGVGVASTTQTLSSVFSQNPDLTQLGSRITGPIAYKEAGIGPSDVDFAQIYDCFSISLILQLEELGFAPRGEGVAFCADGRIAPGGAFPVNTNGGHLSYAYLPGMNHVIEAVRQIRGERGEAQLKQAEVCAVAGLGGNDHATMIVTADR